MEQEVTMQKPILTLAEAIQRMRYGGGVRLPFARDNNHLLPVTSGLDRFCSPHIIQCMLNYLPKPASPNIDLNRMAKWLKVLGEPNRLLIFNFIMEGVQCNCELGDGLQMAPNLISHHLKVMREAGLIEVERDAVDARWMYYSINRQTLEELNQALGTFFDPQRIKPRRLTCGPHGEFIRHDLVEER